MGRVDVLHPRVRRPCRRPADDQPPRRALRQLESGEHWRLLMEVVGVFERHDRLERAGDVWPWRREC